MSVADPSQLNLLVRRYVCFECRGRKTRYYTSFLKRKNPCVTMADAPQDQEIIVNAERNEGPNDVRCFKGFGLFFLIAGGACFIIALAYFVGLISFGDMVISATAGVVCWIFAGISFCVLYFLWRHVNRVNNSGPNTPRTVGRRVALSERPEEQIESENAGSQPATESSQATPEVSSPSGSHADASSQNLPVDVPEVALPSGSHADASSRNLPVAAPEVASPSGSHTHASSRNLPVAVPEVASPSGSHAGASSQSSPVEIHSKDLQKPDSETEAAGYQPAGCSTERIKASKGTEETSSKAATEEAD